MALLARDMTVTFYRCEIFAARASVLQEFFLTHGSARVVDTDTAVRKLRPGDQLQVSLGLPGSTMPLSTMPMGFTSRSKPPTGGLRMAESTPGCNDSTRKSLLFSSGFKPPAKVRH